MRDFRNSAFPGDVTGAPLKHDSPVPAPPDDQPFPGDVTGAPLKHLQPRVDEAASDPFPGDVTGAPLKHYSTTPGLKETDPSFPGVVTGAPLKPGRAVALGEEAPHSPATSPGLH